MNFEHYVYNHLTGCFDLTRGTYISSSNPHFRYSINNCNLEVLGTREKINDVNYNALVVSYDKLNQELQIEQDLFGSPFYLYYCKIDNKIYFSSSLKMLIKQSNIKCRMNYDVINEFVEHGFISTNCTLLQNIYKLMPLEIMHLKKDCFYIKKINIKWPSTKKSEKDFWRKELDILKNCNYKGIKEKKLGLSLSAGYDSNLILQLLLNDEYEPCIVSVGDKSICSEIERVRKICSYYNLTKVDYSFVSDKTMAFYRDIVRRLEGSVFEPGIFLQYELAKKFAEIKCTGVICGECADQIFNCNFFSSELFVSNEFKFGKNPFELASCVILKKSGIMLNSFGMVGYYPYCSKEMVSLAAEYREHNGKTKILHKNGCILYFPTQISNVIKKQGGSTSIGALFSSEQEKRIFIDSTKNGSIAKFISKECTKRFGPDYDYELLNALCIRYLELFKEIFCE